MASEAKRTGGLWRPWLANTLLRLLGGTAAMALLAPGSDPAVASAADAWPEVKSVTVSVRFSGPRYAGTFYSGFLPATDFAVWIESAAGAHLQTLKVTPQAVSVSTYSHLDHLPAWQASTGLTYEDLQAQTSSGVAPSFDGLTQASVLFADAVAETSLVFTWDLGRAAGIALESGQFRFCAEVANIVKNDAAAYQIVAEHACGALDLAAMPLGSGAPSALTVNVPQPTQHIIELTARVHVRPTAVLEEHEAAAPRACSLAPNYPNPFNSTTVIGFALPTATEVELAVYDLAGQRVALLASGQRAPGTYRLTWDGTDDAGLVLASGVYAYRLTAGTYQESRKLLLLR